MPIRNNEKRINRDKVLRQPLLWSIGQMDLIMRGVDLFPDNCQLRLWVRKMRKRKVRRRNTNNHLNREVEVGIHVHNLGAHQMKNITGEGREIGVEVEVVRGHP